MSCTCSELKNAEQLNGISRSLASSLAYQQRSPVLPSVDVSEVSYLKAQVWTLENRLRDNEQSLHNIINSFESVVNEKYELLDELSLHKQLFFQLCNELHQERDNNEVLTEEIRCLQEEVDKNRALLDKAVTQNIELKVSIMKANETIHQMGLMYMKLKEYKH